jgi:hypothetical protein
MTIMVHDEVMTLMAGAGEGGNECCMQWNCAILGHILFGSNWNNLRLISLTKLWFQYLRGRGGRWGTQH